jgi:hypothetical protein
MRPIVFLHIPKTAGQTIHNQLAALVGAAHVSPVRVHTQAPKGPQMPPGHLLYSGHLDWTELDSLPDPFVFTVLRDPAERIASFYFFLLSESQKRTEAELALPAFRGQARIRAWTAEDYFFGGDPPWQTFIRDHYDNFYVAYLATRRVRGRSALLAVPSAERLARALTGAARIERIYSTEALGVLEADILARYGRPVEIVGRYGNAGAIARDQARWPLLLDRMGSDAARRRLEDFIGEDRALMDRITVAA